MDRFKKMIFAALFAALVFVSTTVIKISTPTMGYIHPGDGLVLLSGLFLGPLWGGLAAGFGSMLSDLIGGYLTYVPATFLIKWGTAAIASLLYKEYLSILKKNKSTMGVVLSGALAEAFMVLGYFVYEIFLLGLAAGDGFSSGTIKAGITASADGIPFNVVQGIFGVAISLVLYPLILRLMPRQ